MITRKSRERTSGKNRIKYASYKPVCKKSSPSMSTVKSIPGLNHHTPKHQPKKGGM